MKINFIRRSWSISNFIFSKICIFIFFATINVHVQNGTYELKNNDSSYSLISLMRNKNKITADVFTWWNTPSLQTGSYYGQGVMKNNRVILKSIENDPDCIVTMVITDRTMTAMFQNCTTDHLTEDFNGNYQKISDAVAGDYIVRVNRSFFYSKPDEYSREKSYLMKGDTVIYNLDGGAVGNWVFVHYRNKDNKYTAGYMMLSDLKKL